MVLYSISMRLWSLKRHTHVRESFCNGTVVFLWDLEHRCMTQHKTDFILFGKTHMKPTETVGGRLARAVNGSRIVVCTNCELVRGSTLACSTRYVTFVRGFAVWR